MGVRGLTTFVDERQDQFLQRNKLRDQHVVIDGNSLIYFLYAETQLDFRLGGDYGEFKKVIFSFFKNLEKCAVTSAVVFDGAYDVNKRQTHLSRMQNSVHCVLTAMSGEQDKLVIPVLAGEVMQQTLRQLNIPFVYSEHDADRDIASLANALQSCVLSNDSDFFVFSLRAGYLPLKYFEWREVVSDQNSSYISGRLYSPHHFTAFYKVKQLILSFLPILLGCDWLEEGVFSPAIVDNLSAKVPRSKRQQQNAKSRKTRIDAALKWLSSCSTDENVLEHISKSHHTSMSNIKWCLSFYRDLPDCFENIFILKDQIENAKPSVAFQMIKARMEVCLSKAKPWKPRNDLLSFTRSGNYPSSILNLEHGNTAILLPVVVGKASCVSPHKISYLIRYGAYRLTGCDLVEEFDRVNDKYQKIEPYLAENPAASGAREQFELMPTRTSSILSQLRSSLERSRKYILGVLTCDDVTDVTRDTILDLLESTDRDSVLLFAVTVYWLMKSRPPECVSCSVIMVSLVSDPTTLKDILPLLPVGSSDETTNLNVTQYLSEWQSCLKYAIILNKMLNLPFREPTIAFNCSSIARIHGAISKLKQHELVKRVSDRLKSLPHFQSRFIRVSTAIYRCKDMATTTGKTKNKTIKLSRSQRRRRTRKISKTGVVHTSDARIDEKHFSNSEMKTDNKPSLSTDATSQSENSSQNTTNKFPILLAVTFFCLVFSVLVIQ